MSCIFSMQAHVLRRVASVVFLFMAQVEETQLFGDPNKKPHCSLHLMEKYKITGFVVELK